MSTSNPLYGAQATLNAVAKYTARRDKIDADAAQLLNARYVLLHEITELDAKINELNEERANIPLPPTASMIPALTPVPTAPVAPAPPAPVPAAAGTPAPTPTAPPVPAPAPPAPAGTAPAAPAVPPIPTPPAGTTAPTPIPVPAPAGSGNLPAIPTKRWWMVGGALGLVVGAIAIGIMMTIVGQSADDVKTALQPWLWIPVLSILALTAYFGVTTGSSMAYKKNQAVATAAAATATPSTP